MKTYKTKYKKGLDITFNFSDDEEGNFIFLSSTYPNMGEEKPLADVLYTNIFKDVYDGRGSLEDKFIKFGKQIKVDYITSKPTPVDSRPKSTAKYRYYT